MVSKIHNNLNLIPIYSIIVKNDDQNSNLKAFIIQKNNESTPCNNDCKIKKQ